MLMTTLRRLLGREQAQEHDHFDTPTEQDAAFVLELGSLPIGYLRLENAEWEFRYSPEFIGQSDIVPLVDFPDPKKVYRSAELWPFFVARIPSIEQPRVRETIEQEGLDARNVVDLLRRFGTRTISNPFVLVESTGG